MGYENRIPSNKNSNLPPYPEEYGVKAEYDVPAATKMGASFTHVGFHACTKTSVYDSQLYGLSFSWS